MLVFHNWRLGTGVANTAGFLSVMDILSCRSGCLDHTGVVKIVDVNLLDAVHRRELAVPAAPALERRWCERVLQAHVSVSARRGAVSRSRGHFGECDCREDEFWNAM